MVCRHVVFSGVWQEYVQSQMYEKWEQGEGQQWRVRAEQAFKSASPHDPRNPGASTPSSTHMANKMKQYYKTHCDKTFGGAIWLKVLIAFGNIPNEAVHFSNVVAAKKWTTN